MGKKQNAKNNLKKYKMGAERKPYCMVGNKQQLGEVMRLFYLRKFILAKPIYKKAVNS